MRLNSRHRVRRLIGFLFLFCFLTACTASKPIEPEQALSSPAQISSNIDPYEHYNRNAFRLNDKLDKTLLKPIAYGYIGITPYFFRQGVSNFFNNIGEIPRIANDALQARGEWFLNDTVRLLINSTVGILGLFDVASKLGLPTHTNSFNFTLNRWQAKPSPYFVLPFFGPSSLYDIYRMPMDFYLSPWGTLISIQSTVGLFTLRTINLRANFLQNESLLNQVALDPYLFMRSAYLQSYQQQLSLNQNPPAPSQRDTSDLGEVYTGD